MKRQTISGIIFVLLVTAVLAQPLMLLARKQAAADLAVGNQLVFLPVIQTPPGPPDFEIISPNDGWRVSGMMFVAAQARDPETVTSVTFNAGSTTLGTDNTPADGFRVFFDASSLPNGNVTLTAVGHGPSGQTSKSITVNVVSNPASSGTIGAQGGVLASEIGSLITIPPNALTNSTQLSVDELTQQEVTTQNGIDWEAMGVTFLGAQDIQSTTPFSLPLRVASANFGNRVQPGQAVVNYQIVPDADGDGVDEIVVVNTASVAPNNDVISDPIPEVLVDDAVFVAQRGDTAVYSLGGVGGPPGTVIQLPATGFNPLSTAGNVAEWTCANGQKITVSGTIIQNPANSQSQLFSSAIPLCTPGQALVLLKNLSTGSVAGPFIIQVTAPPPLGGAPGNVTLGFLAGTQGDIGSIPDNFEIPTLPPDWKSQTQSDLDAAQQDVQDRMADQTPENQQALEDSDTLLSQLQYDFSAPDEGDDCLTEASKQALAEQIDHYFLLSSEWFLKGERALGEYYFRIGQTLGQISLLPTCGEEEPECEPAQTAVTGVTTTGMGSAPPPGGNSCGNVTVGSGGNIRTSRSTEDIIIKIFSSNLPTPFSGKVDPGGYFFVPFLPAGAPFSAVAYDLTSGETRAMQGVGPSTGDSYFLYFDFSSNSGPSNTINWDGGGDGTSWHDAFNWDSDMLPGPTDDVIIDVPGEITVTLPFGGSFAIQSLHSEEALVINGTLDISQDSIVSRTLMIDNNGTLTGTGDVVVAGLLNWRSGTMSGSGTTRAEGGIFFDGFFTRWLDGRTLENNSTAVFQNGLISLISGADFTNLPGATLDFQGDFLNGIIGDIGMGSAFSNLGTVIRSPSSGSAYINVPFNNNGTVNIQTDTLTLRGDGVHSGSFEGSGTLQFDGTGTQTLNGALTNLNVLVSLGTVNMNGSYDANDTSITGSGPGLQGTFNIGTGLTANSNTLNLSGGSLTGNGDMSVAGLLTWDQGTMSGTGTTQANGGLMISGTTASLNGRTLTNSGTAVFQGSSLITSNGAVINNLAGAAFDFQGDGDLTISSGGATFNNQGSLFKSSGNGLTSISPTLVNEGSIEVQSGELRFGGDFTQTASGTLFVHIDGLTPITEFDQFNIAGDAILDGTLDVMLGGGFTPSPGDSFAVITFANRTGQFTTINGNGQSYNVNYNANNVTLVAQ